MRLPKPGNIRCREEKLVSSSTAEPKSYLNSIYNSVSLKPGLKVSNPSSSSLSLLDLKNKISTRNKIKNYMSKRQEYKGEKSSFGSTPREYRSIDSGRESFRGTKEQKTGVMSLGNKIDLYKHVFPQDDRYNERTPSFQRINQTPGEIAGIQKSFPCVPPLKTERGEPPEKAEISTAVSNLLKMLHSHNNGLSKLTKKLASFKLGDEIS